MGNRKVPKAGLDTTRVVEAAADLLKTSGVEALTLHNLAEVLGVQTPSLYNHVDGMPGLHRELAILNARLLESRLVEAALGQSGPSALVQLAEEYRAYIKDNPDLYLLTLRASGNANQLDAVLTAIEIRIVHIVLRVLASFGLQGDEALHAARGLRSLVHGFATLEIAGGFGLPLDCDESFCRLLGMFLKGLRPT